MLGDSWYTQEVSTLLQLHTMEHYSHASARSFHRIFFLSKVLFGFVVCMHGRRCSISAQGPNVSCDGVHRALQGKSIHQRSNNESLILFGIIFVA